MFKSQLSGKIYGPGVSPKMVVTKRRQVTYVNEEGKVSTGWEIEEELRIGPDERIEGHNK